MKRRFALTLMLGMAVFLTSGLPSVALLQAQTGQGQPLCCSETRQCISGEFRVYWEQNGGLPVFGYPVTPAKPEIDPASSVIFTSQWFERNRLELHPENRLPYRVLLGRLGDQRLRQAGRNPLLLSKADPSSPHYFGQSGHAIASVF